MAGPGSQDVEMGDATSGVGVGKGDGDVHNKAASPATPAQQTDLPHTLLTFEVKSDLDESQPQQPQQTTTSSSSPVGSSKMKSSAKKKGTAATTGKKGIKKPAVKKVPKSKRGGKKPPASARNATGNDGGGGGGGGEPSSDDETDNGPYCLCRGPDDHRWMIGCDVCEDWFHGECVQLDKETGEKLVERFVCPNCTDGRRNYTKYRKTCSLPGCRNPARLYAPAEADRSVFCSPDHCDAWWASVVATLPAKAASKKAVEVLTREDFMGLLATTAEEGGWKLGEKPFGSIEGLLPTSGPPAPADVLSDEEQAFLQGSAAERLALGNEIVQYKKMMQLMEWANQRRQAAIEAGRFAKETCGYDARLDSVSARHQFAAFLDSPEGQAVFKSGRLDAPLSLPPPSQSQQPDPKNPSADPGPDATAAADAPTPQEDPAVRGMCERKRCKPHASWYKLLTGAVRVLIKETATAAADKLEAEDAVRREAAVRHERRRRENNWFKVLDGGEES